jgi:adenylate cyclase
MSDAASLATPAGPPQHRHAAVAFADIVGYTLLMSVEPERTHARWMELLFGVLRPLACNLGSTIVKSTGDGLLADFHSVADAHTWALAVQKHVRLTDRPDAPPIAFPIGIACGTVEATADDLYGECVNVAARLQEHAPPGGIALTDLARQELPATIGAEAIGTLQLRNIAAPVNAFIIAPSVPPRVPMRAPPRGTPSVAVMPFTLPPGEHDSAYFANGMIEDIVLSLGGLSDLAVTARSATIGWGSTHPDPMLIGRVLGVRYVLTGTLRKGHDRLRLTAELRDCAEGDVLWSDRFDTGLADLFAVQDEIVARVVGGIAPSIRAAELRKALRAPPDDLTAYDHMLHGMHALDALRRDTFDVARAHMDQAIRRDPGFAAPVSWAARWHSFAFYQGWSATPQRDLELWGSMAAKAIDLDPKNAMGHVMLGHYQARAMRDPQGALGHYDRALAICPNSASALSLKSGALTYLGRGAEALALAERALALAPRGPDRFYYCCFMGMAYLALGDHESAARWLEHSVAANPELHAAYRFLIAAQVQLGRHEDAARTARELLRRQPGYRLSVYAAGLQPFVDPALSAQMVSALRQSGVPE